MADDATTRPISTPSSAGGSPSESAARRRARALLHEERPTPADPTPGAEEVAGVPTAKRVAPPPELGTNAIAVLEGRAFFYSDERGDVPQGSIGGFIRNDTRFIGTWVLTMNGQALQVLTSSEVDYYSAAFFLTNPELDDAAKNDLAIRRTRFVGASVQEKLSIHNYADRPIRFELRLTVGTDFADLFEIKDVVRNRSGQITTQNDPDAGAISFRFANDGFKAATTVSADGISRIEDTAFVWDIALDPRGEWQATVKVESEHPSTATEVSHDDFGDSWKWADDSLSRWMESAPVFESDSDALEGVFRRSVIDLAALRVSGKLPGSAEEFSLPAAGLPWFMTLFGRDTLLTALMSMWVGPELARGGLETLSILQGEKTDEFRDEEPGKIAHEIRTGELTHLGLKPHNPYYGSTDATQLWLGLLAEYWRWTRDEEFVRRMRPTVVRALEWIDRYGDQDGDGYVEYQTRSPQGLGNQCWKDSFDGVQFADGTIPYLPIAIAEAQGYTYHAKVQVAELAERIYHDEPWAARLRDEAKALKDRFNRDFWIDARGGYYAVGLDGDKRQIDSMTSNVGQLLATGIVPEDRAKILTDQLMSDEMFSGWGVRTMSTADAGFNPIGYHVGTIWPHDNALIAVGLYRYGYRDEANRISLALIEAATYSGHRLPEAFAGFPREVGRFPVPYPTACSPQAWATAAPFAFITVMLGLDVQGQELVARPAIPESVGRLKIRGLRAFGHRWDVEAVGRNGYVRLAEE
jgi:glycogen debranching enzyme